MNNSFLSYSSWCSSIRVIVLGDAFVTDAQVPGRVPLVCHAVVVNSVVGQRFNLGQITKKRRTKKKFKFYDNYDDSFFLLLDDDLTAAVTHTTPVDFNHSILTI